MKFLNILKNFYQNFLQKSKYRPLVIDYDSIYEKKRRNVWSDSKRLKIKDLKSLNIGKKEFVVMCTKWCDVNLGKKNGQYILKIYYSFSKTYGTYFCDNKTFLIRLWENLLLIDVGETVIHEYVHYLQFSSKKHIKNSNVLEEKLGYDDNPYEIEAREVAAKLKNVCFDAILKELNPNSVSPNRKK